MANELVLRKKDLFDNPTARIPVCLVLDRSLSMSGDPGLGAPIRQFNPRPIDELNDAVAQFFSEVKDDVILLNGAEIATVTFAADVHVLGDFEALSRSQPVKIDLDQYGGTSLGSGVNVALDLLEQRKEEYAHAGVDYYQPWLVIMTDGLPTDETYIAAAARTRERALQRKLVVFPVAIGDGAEIDVLALFATEDRKPMRMRNMAFREFFRWLSQSMRRVGESTPGDRIQLPSTESWRNPGERDGSWDDI